MNYIKRLIPLLLALTLLFTFTACEARDIGAFKENLDTLGFPGMLTQSDFFALAQNFTYEGKTAEELMKFEVNSGSQTTKTNENDTLTMKQETVVEKDGKYATTYQQLATSIPLEGLTLPRGVQMGTSLADALEALVGNSKALTKFKATEGYAYEMLLAEKDDARIIFRDMTRDTSATGYRYVYQIRYTDEIRYMTDNGSVGTKRTLVLSFDNTAEGHPLTMIEIALESRHRA